MLRGDRGEVVFCKSLPGKWSWFEREWLGGRVPLAGEMSRWNLSFFDTLNRLPCLSIEDEEDGVLCHRCDRGYSLGSMLDVEEHRSDGQVVVPQVVMDDLKVPLQFACIRIDSDQ
jgi:hypothetical protein